MGELIEGVGVGDGGDAGEFAGEIVPVALAIGGCVEDSVGVVEQVRGCDAWVRAFVPEVGDGVLGDRGAADVAVVVGISVVEHGLSSRVNLFVLVQWKTLSAFDRMQIGYGVGYQGGKWCAGSLTGKADDAVSGFGVGEDTGNLIDPFVKTSTEK